MSVFDLLPDELLLKILEHYPWKSAKHLFDVSLISQRFHKLVRFEVLSDRNLTLNVEKRAENFLRFKDFLTSLCDTDRMLVRHLQVVGDKESVLGEEVAEVLSLLPNLTSLKVSCSFILLPPLPHLETLSIFLRYDKQAQDAPTLAAMVPHLEAMKGLKSLSLMNVRFSEDSDFPELDSLHLDYLSLRASQPSHNCNLKVTALRNCIRKVTLDEEAFEHVSHFRQLLQHLSPSLTVAELELRWFHGLPALPLVHTLTLDWLDQVWTRSCSPDYGSSIQFSHIFPDVNGMKNLKRLKSTLRIIDFSPDIMLDIKSLNLKSARDSSLSSLQHGAPNLVRLSLHHSSEASFIADIVKCFRDTLKVLSASTFWTKQLSLAFSDCRNLQALQIYITPFTSRKQYNPDIPFRPRYLRSRNDNILPDYIGFYKPVPVLRILALDTSYRFHIDPLLDNIQNGLLPALKYFVVPASIGGIGSISDLTLSPNDDLRRERLQQSGVQLGESGEDWVELVLNWIEEN
ncbi:hypothetical protein BT69DRAFT_1317451 [Atractiella rhizophila]|nr:hypothetical protein BT69DRAFT_1317451 [Atractiella rhizophila]